MRDRVFRKLGGTERFHDRCHAGQRLASMLRVYANRQDVRVFGLPRGGVPVAYEVAQELRAPLDVLVVRKLGAPAQPELAIGAVGPRGVRVLNEDLVKILGVSTTAIEEITAREAAELARRQQAYRGARPLPNLDGLTAILVDDGLATGATMRAAVAAARVLGAAHVVVAVPVASSDAVAQLAREADDVVSYLTPPHFSAVGLWYHDFSQTSDEEVRELLAQAGRASHASTSARPTAADRKER